jgi:hypothetical protein
MTRESNKFPEATSELSKMAKQTKEEGFDTTFTTLKTSTPLWRQCSEAISKLHKLNLPAASCRQDTAPACTVGFSRQRMAMGLRGIRLPFRFNS